MEFSAGSLAPRIYKDPPAYHIFYATDNIPFVDSATQGEQGWATTSPFNDDTRLPEGLGWLDAGWRLDTGALGVCKQPVGGADGRDTDDILEGDITNLGRRAADVGEDGWSYVVLKKSGHVFRVGIFL